jgi:hypothetical protein
MTSLPPPAQWSLKVMSEYEVAEMLERYIDFVDRCDVLRRASDIS